MNRTTLEKLKSNPHYKPSPAVKAAIDQMEVKEEPVETFGRLPINDTSLPIHPTRPRRKAQ